ncbi:MAG: hypothetical protein ABI383_02315 [Acidobacteriaceae bacterium]
MRTCLMALLVSLAFVTTASAHAHGKHLMGTVDSITNNEIVVATASGEKASATLTPETRYVRGKDTIFSSDIKIGEKVVVHAKAGENGKGLVAEEVHVGMKKK